MSLIPHSFFPRSMFDMDRWMQPSGLGISSLDFFDPFDELDQVLGRNLQWLTRPEFARTTPIATRVPQKYRITLDCSGYKPSSIKTEVQGRNLVICAHEEVKEPSGDYSTKEFKKTYNLPERAIGDKMVSFMTTGGKLIVEVPLREGEEKTSVDLFPQIVDTEHGREINLRINVPENVDPNKINVSIKDRDLIVQVEDKVEKQDMVSKLHYYKQTTLPENTDFTALKCNYDSNQLIINAPLKAERKESFQNIPIEIKKEKGSEAIKPSEESAKQPASEQVKPSAEETQKPSFEETQKPSSGESLKPSAGESLKPSAGESLKPSAGESLKPSVGETTKPSTEESAKPSAEETSKPLLSGEWPKPGEVSKPTGAESVSTSIGESVKPSGEESLKLSSEELSKPIGESQETSKEQLPSKPTTEASKLRTGLEHEGSNIQSRG